MSAFLIDYQTYQGFIKGLWKYDLYLCEEIEIFFKKHQLPCETKELNAHLLAYEMLKLNCDSVNYRYKDSKKVSIADIPLPENPSIDYEKDQLLNEMCELFKFMSCWAYQSCEMPELRLSGKQKDLFKLVEALKANLAHRIANVVSENVPSDRAQWGTCNIA